MKVVELGRIQNKYNGTFGIEVEIEGHDLPEELPKQWIKEEDGSLRGESCECILVKPLDIVEAKRALNDLRDAFEDSQLLFSYRTSVHVHVNVMQMEMEQLEKFLYTSYLVEDLLVEFCGGERIGNRFCLRSRDAEYIVELLEQQFKTRREVIRIDQHAAKYSAINLVPMFGRGSVEFRTMRGTLDANTLNTWLNMLHCIRNYAMDVRSVALIADVAEVDKELFLRSVFGNNAEFLMFDGYEDAIQEAIERLVKLPIIAAKNDKIAAAQQEDVARLHKQLLPKIPKEAWMNMRPVFYDAQFVARPEDELRGFFAEPVLINGAA